MKRALLAVIAAILVGIGIAFYFGESGAGYTLVGALAALSTKIIDKIQ